MSIIEDLKLQYRIGGISNKMIYWNVGFFIVSIPLFYQFKLGVFDYPNWLAVSSEPNVVFYKPWTLVTYAFFHYGFFHLFFNMMILNFSSRLFLTYFTQKQYLGLYFLAAIFSGLVFVLSFYLLGNSAMMVGASAAIMALLVATTTYQPLMEIRLLLIGNVKLWHITAVLLLIDLLQIQMSNTGGHIAHLSGAFFGYIYIKLLQNGTDLSRIVTNTITFFATIFDKKKTTPFKKVHVNDKKTIVKRESKIVIKDKTQQQIDEILDKISQSGYDSLTQEEKEFLFQSGK
ncbi:rhomboid family intramembrane serine protease [Flavobacterium dankookense]|uniref:Membrane associated rhomboid family serine protease n=1 Tax=Flavobacterium dankookense TaxID=706186 RepID=A0A4R6QFH0_9FLAO|nr:rhomboid family intramembrane serine protease [Flavobacterium dankookense]TDP60756.1 membrane associated rhomboid family serine protease [Flavobacterium dankookense]